MNTAHWLCIEQRKNTQEEEEEEEEETYHYNRISKLYSKDINRKSRSTSDQSDSKLFNTKIIWLNRCRKMPSQ